jgi:ribosomal protein L37AE/L43A
MPQNPIQFQPGLSLDDFFARYGTEAQCAAALEAARWPQGFVCPHCGATAHSRFQADGRQYWQCARCRAQTSPTCGTLFESNKLALTKGFQAMAPGTRNMNDLSALSLKRHLGVCDRTAWRLKHKLLEAMSERAPLVSSPAWSSPTMPSSRAGAAAVNTKRGRIYFRPASARLPLRGRPRPRCSLQRRTLAST